ncbi:DUF2125 domain-containing protein [Aureimonas frigidaquae]|uniref:DUF2125 domain-containing protein n=1 Tax=Aureimonas frigidaquae TaxID=424757 RepID=UPI0009F865FF|nr:DUF2125 domain-containing protein [Aureimonas frigidaquae]
MNQSRGAGKGSRSVRAMIGIAGVALLLAAGLTGAWFYLAGEVDRRVVEIVDRAAGGGTAITCDGRRVFGYPFRMGLACDRVGVEAPASGMSAAAGGFRAVAQIYNPNLIVSELDAPLRLAAPELPPIAMNWTLAQASTHLSDGRLQRFSMVLDAPSIMPDGATAPLVQSQRLEVHARQNADDLDLALTDIAVTATPPGVGPLPPFDLSADLSVAGGAEWLHGVLPGGRLETALRGRSGSLRSLRLSLEGGGAAEISGPFQFSAEGLLTGTYEIALQNPQAIADLVSRILPPAGGIANAIAGGVGLVGRQVDGRTVIEVEVRDGRARLGFIPLGNIPPL